MSVIGNLGLNHVVKANESFADKFAGAAYTTASSLTFTSVRL